MNPVFTVRPHLRGPILTALLAAVAASPALGQMPAPAVSSLRPIHLGGYASVVAQPTMGGGRDSVSLTGARVALLVSGTVHGRLSYFSEVEGASRSIQNWTGRRDDRGVSVERLYVEYAFSDLLRLRAGRFLTPIGQWNEIHAAPLTWTALRPLTTYYPFAKSTTGLMAAGQLVLAGRDAGYALYYAPMDWGRELGEENSFVWALGGRVALELEPGLTLGASAAAVRVSHPYDRDDPDVTPDSVPPLDGREEDRVARRLVGADVAYNGGRFELLSEGVLLSASAPGTPMVRGGFVQLAVRTIGRLYAVGRTEVYDPVINSTVHIQTLGLTLRPSRHWTFKLDRQFTDHPSRRVRSGWFVSASALF